MLVSWPLLFLALRPSFQEGEIQSKKNPVEFPLNPRLMARYFAFAVWFVTQIAKLAAHLFFNTAC